jgi:hypothetical protein
LSCRRAYRSSPLLALAVLLAAARPARADEAHACAEPHLAAQRHRRAGELVRAREALLACSRAECSSVLAKDCVAWLGEVEAALPSVTLEAKTAEGRDATDATARIDGEPAARRIDGRALPLDPGPHRIVFERPGKPSVEEQIVLREGEKRVVTARFRGQPAALAPARDVERPIPPLAWVAGGVTLAAATTFGVFGAMGASGHGDLESRGCAPSCPADEVDEVRRDLVVADVALGVALVAATATLVLVLTRPAAPPRAAHTARWTALQF